MLLILFLSYFFASTFAQVPVFQEPHFNQIVDFNKSAFAGTWYEIYRIPSFMEFNEICSAATFEYNKPLGTYNIVLNAINPITKGLRNSIAACFPKPNEHSAFTFRYPIKPPVNLGVLTILDTDYDNYAVIAGVIPLSQFYLVFAWIDSRTTTCAPEYYEKAVQVLRANNIPPAALKQVEQSCPNIVNAK